MVCSHIDMAKVKRVMITNSVNWIASVFGISIWLQTVSIRDAHSRRMKKQTERKNTFYVRIRF